MDLLRLDCWNYCFSKLKIFKNIKENIHLFFFTLSRCLLPPNLLNTLILYLSWPWAVLIRDRILVWINSGHSGNLIWMQLMRAKQSPKELVALSGSVLFAESSPVHLIKEEDCDSISSQNLTVWKSLYLRWRGDWTIQVGFSKKIEA